MQATGKQLITLASQGLTGNGDGTPSVVALPLMIIPKSVGARWKVVGVGAYIYHDGASTVAEKILWGHYASDLGSIDSDAFGSFVQDTTADKQVKDGDFIYAGIAPFSDYFDFDAPELAGSHIFDISGTGAGVLMGVWQTKSTHIVMSKENVASSTATAYAFMLVEYEQGGGVT
jgi:hypothetical protein